MKNLIFCLCLISISTVQYSCNEKCHDVDPIQYESLIFGLYAGECAGNCATMYKIENGALYEDDIDYYLHTEIDFKNEPLSTDKYEIAKVMIEEFPESLLESDKRVYGCPDCADQGGVYLELEHGVKIDIWNIDTGDSEQGQELLDYKALFYDVLEQLK